MLKGKWHVHEEILFLIGHLSGHKIVLEKMFSTLIKISYNENQEEMQNITWCHNGKLDENKHLSHRQFVIIILKSNALGEGEIDLSPFISVFCPL